MKTQTKNILGHTRFFGIALTASVLLTLAGCAQAPLLLRHLDKVDCKPRQLSAGRTLLNCTAADDLPQADLWAEFGRRAGQLCPRAMIVEDAGFGKTVVAIDDNQHEQEAWLATGTVICR